MYKLVLCIDELEKRVYQNVLYETIPNIGWYFPIVTDTITDSAPIEAIFCDCDHILVDIDGSDLDPSITADVLLKSGKEWYECADEKWLVQKPFTRLASLLGRPGRSICTP